MDVSFNEMWHFLVWSITLTIYFLNWHIESIWSVLTFKLLTQMHLKLIFNVLMFKTGGCLTKIHLIEIVFYQLIKIFIISWPNFFRLFTWSKNLINCQKKTCKFWHMIESSNNGFLIRLGVSTVETNRDRDRERPLCRD
jgi:hypothetical protein